MEITLMDTGLKVLDCKLTWRKSLWCSVLIKKNIYIYCEALQQFAVPLINSSSIF